MPEFNTSAFQPKEEAAASPEFNVSAFKDTSSFDSSALRSTETIENNRKDLVPIGTKAGIKLGDSFYEIPVEVAAFTQGMEHGLTDIWRGLKQIAGIDEEEMRVKQKFIDSLLADPDLQVPATAGLVTGLLAEPAGLVIPGVKGGTIAKAVVQGSAIGFSFGALGYVNEDKGQTRLGNAALGGSIGAIGGGVIRGAGKGVEKVQARRLEKANRTVDEVEKEWASKLMQNIEPSEISKELKEDFPRLLNNLKGATKKTGRRPNLALTKKQATDLLDHYNDPTKKSDIAMGVESIAGIVSTRVKNIHVPTFSRVRKYEYNVPTKTHEKLTTANEFISSYSKGVSREAKETIDQALLSGNFEKVRDTLKGQGNFTALKSFEDTDKLLRTIGDDLYKHGIISNKLTNYWPRYLKDKEGLFAAVGKQHKSKLESALSKARTKAATRGYPLSSVEESLIVNSTLRGFPVKESKSSFAKQRVIDDIPKEWMKYYHSPEASLHSYIRNSTQDLEKSAFFGKHMKYTRSEGVNIASLDESVGSFVNEALKKRELSTGQADELAHLLSVRFGIGERSPIALVQDTKNIMYASLLANPINAATQLGDIGVSVYLNGFKNTFKGLVDGRVSPKDFGLVDRLSQEFATMSKTTKFLNASFKYSGFQTIDLMGKKAVMNGALAKAEKQALTPKGQAALKKEWGKVFGSEFSALVGDLQNKQVTDNVKFMMFNKLSDVQPISLSEVPELYLKMKNGRVMYMLKSFMLKQVDVLRRDGYQEIKRGNTAKGLANLGRYALIVGSTGAGASYVKDLVKGKDIDEVVNGAEFTDIGTNLVKTFGWSEYVGNKLAQGKNAEAVLDTITPPFKLFDKLYNTEKMEFKEGWEQYLPVGGKIYYYWFDGGIEKLREKERKKEVQEFNSLLNAGEDELEIQ